LSTHRPRWVVFGLYDPISDIINDVLADVAEFQQLQV
jgi:hypothetical protein